MITLMRKITTILLLALSLAACTVTEITPSAMPDDPATVELDFGIPGEAPGTKSSYSSVGSSVDDVNLWVVSGGTVILHEHLVGRTALSLTLDRGRSYSFYALANMGTAILEDITDVSPLLSLRVALSGIDLDGGGSLPMAGTVSDITLGSQSMSLSVPLKRLFSKVVLRFSPDADLAANGARVKSVVLKNSASDMTPFVQNSYAESCVDGDRATAADLESLNSGGQVEFYCLENCCGRTSNTDPWAKLPESAPKGNPTYLEVKASVDGFQMSGDIVYRFCIGEDNTSDYNLVRNTTYTVTLKSLCATVDGGSDEWKIDSGDVTISEGNIIQLYVGQFHKVKLSPGDEVSFFNEDRQQWQAFVNYSDDDYYSQTLRNGMNLTTYYSEEDGSSCNPDFYFFSTARTSDVLEKVKVVHGDGTTDLYTVRPPIAPTGFDDFSEFEVLDDGMTCQWAMVALTGSLGTVDADVFRIPAGYDYAELPYSTTGYVPVSMHSRTEVTLPDHLLAQWKAEVENTSQIAAALRESGRWSLFCHLYLEDTEGSTLQEQVTDGTDGCAGIYFDCLNYASFPRLYVYGLDPTARRTAALANRLFSQRTFVTVTTSFPSQGDLGECWNYELAPNSLRSNVGCSLPSGISPKASFTIEGNDSYISLSGRTVRFSFPASGTPNRMPAGGHYEFKGSLTNPFSGVKKTGTYSADIILYLPLVATVRVVSSEGTNTVVAATAALAATDSFHADTPVFENLYSAVFNPVIGYRAAFRLGGSTTMAVYPSGSQVDSNVAEFETASGVNVTDYSLSWLANYAAVHLTGFVDNLGTSYSEVNIYPSYSQEMKNKLSQLGDTAIYAKLVLFDSVNTTLTPAYNYYGEGKYLYELLWGKKWQ